MTADAIRSTHLALSEQDWKFRQYAQGHEDCLRRATYGVLDRPNPLLKYRLQSWPTFVGRARTDEIARLARAINRLVRSIPAVVFGNDPVKVSRAYAALSPPLLEMLLAPPDGIDVSLSRGDFIDTAEGMKCLEFNFSPSLGGWETAILAKIHLGIAATSRFVAEAGLAVSFTDTMAILFRHILCEVRDHLGLVEPEVNLALVVSPGDAVLRLPELTEYLRSAYAPVRAERGVGGRVAVCCFKDFTTRAGDLLLRGAPIRCVIDLTEEPIRPEVYRCFKRGRLCLLNTPVGVVLTSKLNLAILSELAEEGAFDAADRALIARHLPWTRRVVADFVRFEGERAFLPDLLLGRQRDLVLKEARAWGGSGVALGKATPREEWEKLVAAALGRGGWVVQELVHSRPYLYQNGEVGCSPHDVIWGPFVFGDTYAGVILRMQPQAEERAVNLSLNATEGIVFEV
jgi:hypothetical protein